MTFTDIEMYKPYDDVQIEGLKSKSLNYNESVCIMSFQLILSIKKITTDVPVLIMKY